MPRKEKKKKRRSPRPHTVRPKHSRYNVKSYSRGKKVTPSKGRTHTPQRSPWIPRGRDVWLILERKPALIHGQTRIGDTVQDKSGFVGEVTDIKFNPDTLKVWTVTVNYGAKQASRRDSSLDINLKRRARLGIPETTLIYENTGNIGEFIREVKASTVAKTRLHKVRTLQEARKRKR